MIGSSFRMGSRKTAMVCAIGVAAMLMVGGSTVASADAPPGTASSGSVDGSEYPPSCYQVNGTGEQIWPIGPSAELDALMDGLSGLHEAHRDEILETAMCSDANGAILYAKQFSPATIAELEDLEASYPDYPVYVVNVAHSSEDLELAGDKMRLDKDLTGKLSMFYPDRLTGGFYIALNSEKISDNFDQVVDQVRREIVALIGPSIPLEFGEMPPITLVAN